MLVDRLISWRHVFIVDHILTNYYCWSLGWRGTLSSKCFANTFCLDEPISQSNVDTWSTHNILILGIQINALNFTEKLIPPLLKSKMHYYLPAYQTSESNINFLIFRKNDSEGNDKSRTSLLKGGVEEKMKKGQSKSTNFIRFSLSTMHNFD